MHINDVQILNILNVGGLGLGNILELLSEIKDILVLVFFLSFFFVF